MSILKSRIAKDSESLKSGDYIKSIRKAIPKLSFSLLAVLLCGFIFSSCSDDTDMTNGIHDANEIVIQFAIPDLHSVLTRADGESYVNNVQIFVFDKSEISDQYDALVFAKSYESSEITDNSVSVRLGGDVRNDEVMIYLVANGDQGLKDLTQNEGVTIEDIRKYVLSSPIDGESIPMIGYKTMSTTASVETLGLTRSVAKISAVTSDVTATVEGLHIYRNATQGYLSAPINKEDNYKNYLFSSELATNEPSEEDFTDENNLLYTYPSIGTTHEDYNSGSYLIMKVNRNSKDQYYRLNMRKEDAAGNLVYIDSIKPNHHYSIEITGFFTDGYPSASEAARHPESDQFVVYKIHDHAAEVLSMVTDGYRELGVTPNVTLRSSNDTTSFVVKVFSPEDIDYSEEITFEQPEWLTIIGSKGHDYSDDYSQTWDEDSPGNQYEYRLTITPNAGTYEDMQGDITVKWKGLKRTITVTFEAAFLLPDVCSVKLTMFDGSGTQKAEIKDYWTFVTGQGASGSKDGTGLILGDSLQTPRLFGIKTENLIGEKKRLNGFHFPMPYGEKQDGNKLVVDPWKYEYEIDFQNLADLSDTPETISRIEAVINGDQFIKDNISWSYESGSKGKLLMVDTESVKKSYEYAGGTITFTVYYENSESTSEIVTSLYHTGFFHYEGNTDYAPEKELGYYYYEVVPMAGGFWIDRNIGAKANKSYFDTEDELAETGRESAGRHYTIIKNTNDFSLPTWDFDMIPPGYHVPNSSEWDELRLHNNFVTQSVNLGNTLYMSTYYQTGNPKIGDIYFQKARFCNSKNLYETNPKYNDLANSGDAGAGYYWTVTEAPAMEKEHMGNWLRALYLNGSSSTYNNASVTDHRMPIRCKAGTQDDMKEAEEYYVSFNVHDVTHVYLFDRSTQTPLYTFPGKAVGTAASASKWQHFTCSTTIRPEDLLMLFVNLDADGQVWIYRKIPRSSTPFFKDRDYDKSYLSEDYAWEIESGKYYDFCSVGLTRSINPFTKADDTEWAKDCGQVVEEYYPEDDNGSGGNTGGGNQGGGNPNVNPADYTFTIEDPSKETDLKVNKQYFNSFDGNNQDLAYDKYNWSDVTPGSILRIYTVVIDDEYKLEIFNSNWNKLYDVYKSNISHTYEASNTTESIFEITLTQDLLNNIINSKGLIFQGQHCVLLGITLVMEERTLLEGDFYWSSSLNNSDWNNPFNELKSNNYNWDSVKAGDTLTLTFEAGDGRQIDIRNGNGQSIPGIPDYRPSSWGGNMPSDQTQIIITFDDEMLTNIRNNGGLVIEGGGYTLKRVELKVN